MRMIMMMMVMVSLTLRTMMMMEMVSMMMMSLSALARARAAEGERPAPPVGVLATFTPAKEAALARARALAVDLTPSLKPVAAPAGAALFNTPADDGRPPTPQEQFLAPAATDAAPPLLTKDELSVETAGSQSPPDSLVKTAPPLVFDDEPPSDKSVRDAMPTLVPTLSVHRTFPAAPAAAMSMPPAVTPLPENAITEDSVDVAEVIVPSGTQPGEVFRAIIADGRELTICCPDDAEPGDVLEVDLPPTTDTPGRWDPESPDRMGEFETVEVAIPPDLDAGSAFTVQASWGGVFEVVVPSGTVTGSTLFVELPKHPPTDRTEGAPTPAKPTLAV